MKLKLNCSDVDALLDAFEDNEIDSVTSLRVQKHLDSCTGCRTRHGWLQSTSRSLARIRQRTPEPSPELRRRVAGLPDERQSRTLSWLPSLYQAAALLVLVFALTFLLLPQAGLAEMDARVFVRSHNATQTVEGSDELDTHDPIEAAAWLRDRLPEARAPRGAPPGYRLTGARITEVAGRPVGLLLYEDGARKISCFVPSGRLELTRGFDEIAIRQDGLTAGRCRGHQIVSWSGSGGAAVVIGEIADEALLAFATVNFGPAAELF